MRGGLTNYEAMNVALDTIKVLCKEKLINVIFSSDDPSSSISVIQDGERTVVFTTNSSQYTLQTENLENFVSFMRAHKLIKEMQAECSLAKQLAGSDVVAKKTIDLDGYRIDAQVKESSKQITLPKTGQSIRWLESDRKSGKTYSNVLTFRKI